MNKTEFITKVAEVTGFTKKDSTIFVDAAIDVITEALINKEKISFTGFGTLEPTVRAARKGVNPQTKLPIDIPESNSVHFKVGATLKSAIQ